MNVSITLGFTPGRNGRQLRVLDAAVFREVSPLVPPGDRATTCYCGH